MMFAAIAVLSLLGLLFRQTSLRFLAEAEGAGKGKKAPAFKPGAYLSWLGKKTVSLFRGSPLKRLWAWFEGWTSARYPGWMKWIFAAFVGSFLYLAASGLFFAVFIPRGMYGFPLVAHVSLGAVFALSLAFILIRRARDYRFDDIKKGKAAGRAGAFLKTIPKAFAVKLLFWGFAAAGLIIIATALLSMLPWFPATAQTPLTLWHKYAALASILAAVLFVDLAFLPEKR